MNLNFTRKPLFTTVFMLLAGVLCAQEPGSVDVGVIREIPLPQIFTFLFLMLGPFKIIGPFAKMTLGAETPLTRSIAVRGTVMACLALLLAGLLGQKMLTNFDVSLPVLALTAGIILFHVALTGIFSQFEPRQQEGEMPEPSLAMAMSPLAFPTIVTPYGLAALIVFLGLQHDIYSQLSIAIFVVGVMLLNLLAMLYARSILKKFGWLLQILGAVLGIIQVALGLNIIIRAIQIIWL